MRHRPAARLGVSTLAVAVLLAACTAGGDADQPPPTASVRPTTVAPPEPSRPATAGPDTGATSSAPRTEDEEVAVGAYGVSAGHPDAVAVGMDVLAEGGTAVDAAVATAFAVSVVEPFASGIGGGGATLVHALGASPRAYDYREVVAEDGRVPASGTGVPGFVAGMERLHGEHGELPWDGLVAPAARLAEEGVPASDILADQLRSGAARLDAPQLDPFFPDGRPLAAGDPLVQPELAETLRQVADQGAAAVYEDGLGRRLTEVAGIDAASLAGYEVTTPEPALGSVGRFEVVGAAPPLTGVTLIQMLQMATALGAGEEAPGTAGFVDAVSTAWQRANEDLLTRVGDPAFVDVPMGELTDAQANAAAVEGDPTPGAGGSGATEGEGNTTHITVVDASGTVVSMTNTLTNFWGSGQEVAGFFLNDQLRRFELGEGPANEPEPGKRSVSYSSPTIVADERGRPVLGLGSPGGSRIPTVLTQVILRWGLHGESLQEAVDGPRFHAEEDVLYLEPGLEAVTELTELGYRVEQEEPWPYYFGSVQALEVDYDAQEIRGAQDGRRAGAFDVAEVGD